ncbi:MAG TPA: hypothetical protein VGZ00_07950 [Candidatus Baltobacteraceae bacterium]|nr:hypothetical protein [Candidatus Baltobacteraceae bacterium]
MGTTIVLAVAAAQTLDISDDQTQMGVITAQSSALAQLGLATELFIETPSLLGDIKQRFHSSPKSNYTTQHVLSESRVRNLSTHAYTILADRLFSPAARKQFEVEIQHRACLEPVRKKRTLDPEFTEYFYLESTIERIQRVTNEFIESFKADFNANSERNSRENVREAWDATLWDNFQGLMKKAITEIFSDDFSVEGWLRKRERDLSNNRLHLQLKMCAAVKTTDFMDKREIFKMFTHESHENWDFSAPEVRRKIKKLLEVASQRKRERHAQLHNEPSEPAVARGSSIG